VGYADISAEIRTGTLRDAILFACGANSTHGERRSNRDKRKSVCTLLEDAEWSHWSDRRIADVCGVSHPFVSEVRQSLVTVTSDNSHDETNTRQYVNKHGTTSTMRTSNIGKRATGEHKTRQEPELSPVQASTDETLLMSVVPNEEEISLDHGREIAISCQTCTEVRPLIDEALAQLRSMHLATKMDGYMGCEQVLLTVRQLVAEKMAVSDA
jgi:hypothetical protein